MKKFKYLLLIAIISFFVTTSESKAACALPPRPEHIASVGQYFSGENLAREMPITFYIFTLSNGCRNIYLEDGFDYDDKIFELVEFKSKYDFEYNNKKIKYIGDMNNVDYDGYTGKIDDGSNDLINLYAITLKVKEDAILGETKVNGQKYNIVCSPNDTECADNSSDIKEDNNNEEIQKPDNNKNDSNIENDNNQENNKNEKVILDDTKFYVLAGLLGTVVIEMFVLILKKSKRYK